MGRKKTRVTTELIDKMDNEGIESLTRQESRALFQKGYLERVYMRDGAGTIRNGYKIVSTSLINKKEVIK